MLAVPGLQIPRQKYSANSEAKIEQLAQDLAKLKPEASVKMTQGNVAVPAFQRQGYLEKLGHNRNKWFKRFFVLRDSFLLSYNLAKSDFTTEPRSCIHLGDSKISLADPQHDRDFCFSVTTETGDTFLFAATNPDERDDWFNDMLGARVITHANMVKLGVENSVLAKEKGVGEVARESFTTSLAVFSNQTYIKETPLTGGIEGWLSTTGFNYETTGDTMVNKSPWKRCYFMLRDSHLLMFNGGDILTKPRGVMYLVGTATTALEPADDYPHRLLVRSATCGDMIELAASSEKSKQRWLTALTVGSRVTYPDHKLLEKERLLLAETVLTPRAPTPRGPGQTPVARETLPSVLDEEVDIQGYDLAPGAVQPYDENGVPLVRNPQGQLVNPQTDEIVPPTNPRYSEHGELLDAYNRPLPPDAVPMFTEIGQPILIGPDGQHYTPDGEIVDKYEPHFDKDANQLEQGVVDAAELVAPTIKVAVAVRAQLKGENAVPESVDALGQPLQELGGDKVLTVDGQEVPTTARRVQIGGEIMTYEQAQQKETVTGHTEDLPEVGMLLVKSEDDGGEHELGEVEVDALTTLQQVRSNLAGTIDIKNFVFLVNGVPLTKFEERSRLAIKHMPEIFIRGTELSVEKKQEKFTKKVAQITSEQQKQEEKEAEFLNILQKVRQGKFLKPVNRGAE